jgi:hypothetical protein
LGSTLGSNAPRERMRLLTSWAGSRIVSGVPVVGFEPTTLYREQFLSSPYAVCLHPPTFTGVAFFLLCQLGMFVFVRISPCGLASRLASNFPSIAEQLSRYDQGESNSCPVVHRHSPASVDGQTFRPGEVRLCVFECLCLAALPSRSSSPHPAIEPQPLADRQAAARRDSMVRCSHEATRTCLPELQAHALRLGIDRAAAPVEDLST